MRFLLDQGQPRTTVEGLSQAGHVAEHVGQLGMSKSSDDEILAAPCARSAVVVMLDADFHMLLAVSNATRPSVIRVRIEGLRADAVVRVIHEAVEVAESELLAGAVVTVTAIRVHRLPIGGPG